MLSKKPLKRKTRKTGRKKLKTETQINIRNIPAPLRPYYIAKKKGKLNEDFLKRFEHLKYNYRDDLPPSDVRNLDFDKKNQDFANIYKCRGSYIVSLSLELQTAVDDKVIKDSLLIKKIQEFRHHDFNFHHGRFTSREEMKMINGILGDVISYLKKKNRKV